MIAVAVRVAKWGLWMAGLAACLAVLDKWAGTGAFWGDLPEKRDFPPRGTLDGVFPVRRDAR